jgi:two-component system response regulator CpxR
LNPFQIIVECLRHEGKNSMPVIALFSGTHCHGDEVVRKIAENLGYEVMIDQALVTETAKRFQLDESKLTRAMFSKPSIFNKFTHEKERSLACLKSVLADWVAQDNRVFFGQAVQLIPRDIAHVLKVGVIADMKYRMTQLMGKEGVGEKEALKRLHRDDENIGLWLDYCCAAKDPWAPEYYDIIVPMDKSSVSDAVALIGENAMKPILKVSDASLRAVDDFRLAAQVELVLIKEGHQVPVTAREAVVTLTINKHVLKLAALETELKRIAGAVSGVKGVETKVGPGYYQTDIYRKFDFEVPSKVLLVDDEREFVHMLSDRLEMRDMGAAVVYDGEQALAAVSEEEPEVMVLDLKMPGIDGIEVLRRVKTEHPDVEVIVLTGHGSDEIKQRCMELGACAYLEKPVDIETLTQSMKEAYHRARSRKAK